MDLRRLLLMCSFIRLSGAQDITTVNQVSVRRGQSVVIPCLYNQKYAFSRKYVSAGYFWLWSDDVEVPEKRCLHKTVSVSDDTARHSFILHMDNVQESGYYWCAIRIPSALDKRAGFFLNVTAESPRLLVDSQNVTGSENGSVSITCRHQGQSGVKWCKFGGQCVSGASGTFDGAWVEIRHGLRHTTVVLSRLKKENTGWYWCSAGDLQMPVHITVEQNNSQKSPLTAGSEQNPPSARRRTAVLFLLPVILEILLMILIHLALKLFRFCRSRLRSEDEAEEGQYVTMHRKQSSRVSSAHTGSVHTNTRLNTLKDISVSVFCQSYGCAAEGEYENMAALKTNHEITASGHKSTGPDKRSDLSNESPREPCYVNIMKT